MKLATFKIKATGQVTIGVFDGENYIDVVALSDGEIPNSLVTDA